MADISDQRASGVEVVSAYSDIPYSLINAEVEGSAIDVITEMEKIMACYKVYSKGASFATEGSGGSYLPSQLKYRTAASLINKEARFLFGETPDIVINAKGDVGELSQESKDMIDSNQDLINTIFKQNKFSKTVLQAAKDCFIGKRVACMLNFNEEDGVTITFLPSLNFIYETDMTNQDKLTKFVAFMVVRNRTAQAEKRVYKKKFQMEDDGFCWFEEAIYDGRGVLVEEINEYQPTKFTRIPAVIIANDGLTGESDGISEIDVLKDFESSYSKLANADIDAERKSMNQIKYAIDLDPASTKGLSSSPGSFWDLTSDQNLDKPSPQIGTLSSSMDYSQALNTTMDRLKNEMFDLLDVPNLNIETMSGTITSGKALKAIYWPLIVRSKEKMKTWGPQLEYIVDVILEGAILYPNTIRMYTNNFITPVDYEIHIVPNFPLPEDEIEEKTMDISEVTAQTMSRKSFMKKWYQMTDQEAEDELAQIVMETQMLSDTFGADAGGGFAGDGMDDGAEEGTGEGAQDDEFADEEGALSDLEGELDGV